MILVRRGILAALENVLDGDQSLEDTLGIHYRQLFDPVLPQEFFRFIECRALGGGHQVFPGHGLPNGAVQVPLELEVTIGDDAHQAAAIVHDRDAGDPEPRHQLGGVANRPIGTQRDRIHDHAAFRTLDPIHLGGLPIDGHVLVQDTDTAELYRWVPRVEERMRSMPSLLDVTSDLRLSSPKLTVEIDRDKAQALGLNPGLADRKRTDNVYWVDVDLKPTDGMLNPSDLQGESGHISRLELKACPAGPTASS